MAFSMFMKSPAITHSVFRQQIMKLATQPSLLSRNAAATTVPLTTLSNNKNTPLISHVRSFRTSNALLSDEKPHDHSKLWVIEKAVALAMVPMVPVALLLPNRIFDSILAILITAHTFWGLEAIAVDYVRAAIFGPVIPKIAIGLVYLLSIATLGGLFYIISHDIGIANTVRQIWAIKTEQKA